MFILKAVYRHLDTSIPQPDDHYVTEAWAYEVKWSRFEGVNSCDQPTGHRSTEPVDTRIAQIRLFDENQNPDVFRGLFVGYGQTFERVYVMNERGHTVDVVKL